ncbi:MAG TPA: hypothetical protein VFU48_11950, partial [Nitrospira sp.]|nr:hypothetical protein [Nitrospira sp.]
MQIPGEMQIPGIQEQPLSSPQERSSIQAFPVLVKEAPTEFQQFVATSVGRELPLFGYNLFEQVPSTFAPVDRVPVTADYLIGPGDELLIRAWGQIDL